MCVYVCLCVCVCVCLCLSLSLFVYLCLSLYISLPCHHHQLYDCCQPFPVQKRSQKFMVMNFEVFEGEAPCVAKWLHI